MRLSIEPMYARTYSFHLFKDVRRLRVEIISVSAFVNLTYFDKYDRGRGQVMSMSEQS